MRICVGSDEETPLVDLVVSHSESLGHHVERLGLGADWTEVGHAVGSAVACGSFDEGVVCCTTGTGVSIAANKIPGTRAALCKDAATAVGARRWNDANVLALALSGLTEELLVEILDAFFTTAVDVTELGTIRGLER